MKFKRLIHFLLVILLLAVFSIYYPKLTEITGKSIAEESQNYTSEKAILVRVIDGDTIVVTGPLIGNNTHIRMLGINTPEKNMPFANSGKELLKIFENKTIILERDWEDTDKYNPKLRYVFYEKRFLNLEILENGFANSYYTSGLKYEKNILNAEKQARQNNLGIWQASDEICSKNKCIILKELKPAEEFFVIKNTCSFECNLSGWFVKDAGRNIFYLNLENLETNQEQTYNSKEGKDIWNNEGDKLFMFDKKGFLVFFYEY